MRRIAALPLIAILLINLGGRPGLLAGEVAYDPLAIASGFKPNPLDMDVVDKARDRTIPIRVYLPQARASAPVLLFSHGLGGSRNGSQFLGQHWSARGYVVVYVQHPGSDVSVWQDKPLTQRMAAMKQAANAQNLLLRVKDIPAVLDQLAIWSKDDKHSLCGRLDLKRIGMSGHSFGAITTQAVSGQAFVAEKQSYTDGRIKAAMPFSPSAPKRGDAKESFGKVAIPWMLMTGTNDVSPIGDIDVDDRLAVYPALPDGGKYEIVLNGAKHSVFGDAASGQGDDKEGGLLKTLLARDKEDANPNHHRVILALSTAFWDAYLKEDAKAKSWLDNTGPAAVIEKADRWQHK